MKILKTVLLVFLVIVVLFVGITLLIPGELYISRSITVDSPAKNVYSQVVNLKNREKWSAWMDIDPDMKLSYDGEGGIGSSYSWVSENPDVGNGSIKIINADPPESIETELYFYGEKMANGYWSFKEENGKTEVKWEMKGNMSFISKWFIPTMEQQVGESFEKSLAKLKSLAESMPSNVIVIKTVNLPVQIILAIKDSTTGMDQVAAKLGKGYGEIMAFMQKNNIEFFAPPVAISNSWDEGNWNFEMGIPVKEKKGKTTGRIFYQTIPEGQFVLGIYYGPYEKAEPAYNQIMEYIKANSLEENGRPYEQYMNDPQKVAPEEILTHIYFPVK